MCGRQTTIDFTTGLGLYVGLLYTKIRLETAKPPCTTLQNLYSWKKV